MSCCEDKIKQNRCEEPCPPKPCGCSIELSTLCVVNEDCDEKTCLGIKKGDRLHEIIDKMEALCQYVHSLPDEDIYGVLNDNGDGTYTFSNTVDAPVTIKTLKVSEEGDNLLFLDENGAVKINCEALDECKKISNLTINKNLVNSGDIYVGDTVEFTIEIVNNSTNSDIVTLVDIIPDGFILQGVTPDIALTFYLEPNESKIFTYSGIVSQEGSFLNIATVRGLYEEGNVEDNNAFVEFEVLERIIPTSTPTLTDNTQDNGTALVTTINSCMGNISKGIIELYDFDNDKVAEFEYDFLTNSWTDIYNNISQHLVGDFDSFIIDYESFANTTILPLQTGVYTVESRVICDGILSENQDRFSSDCINPPLKFTILDPIGLPAATVISESTNLVDVGDPYHFDWRFLLGKNISGYITSEQAWTKAYQQNRNILIKNTTGQVTTDNPSVAEANTGINNFTITFDNVLSSFIIECSDFDGGLERVLNLRIQGFDTGGDNLDIIVGNFSPVTFWGDSTIKDVYSSTANSYADIEINKPYSFNTISFDTSIASFAFLELSFNQKNNCND